METRTKKEVWEHIAKAKAFTLTGGYAHIVATFDFAHAVDGREEALKEATGRYIMKPEDAWSLRSHEKYCEFTKQYVITPASDPRVRGGKMYFVNA